MQNIKDNICIMYKKKVHDMERVFFQNVSLFLYRNVPGKHSLLSGNVWDLEKGLVSFSVFCQICICFILADKQVSLNIFYAIDVIDMVL